MKLTLKLLLLLLLVIAAIYAASPFWLPTLLNRQLPPGWQLEQIDANYPGISGVRVAALRIKGRLQTADITLVATGIDFSYKGLKTEISSMKLNVFVKGRRDTKFDPLASDAITIPVLNLGSKIPHLSVSHLRMTLGHQPGDSTDMAAPVQPITLDFGSLDFVPRPDDSYHLVTEISFEAIPIAPGLLELDINPGYLKAKVQFPADVNSPKWLSADINQTSVADQQNTEIQMVINTSLTDQDWIDSILSRGSGGLFSHVDGSLQVHAGFGGAGQHKIQQLSLDADNLQLQANGEMLGLKTSLLARYGQGGIHVTLRDQTVIQYQDSTGTIGRFLTSALPEFQGATRAETETILKLEPGSEWVIQTLSPAAFQFNGDIHFSFNSGSESLELNGHDISVVATNFPNLESMRVDGLAHIEWKEQTAIKFALPDLELTAEGLSVSADISSIDGVLLSTGSGSLIQPKMAGLATSADRLDLRWQDLDPDKRSGSFFTQTHGFRQAVDGDTWSGFDFNLNYRVLNGEQLLGSGEVTFDQGPGLPIELSGNIDLNQWKIKAPQVNIKASRLVKLLKMVKAELPPSFKITDGLLNMQAEAEVDGGVRANAALLGQQFKGSIKKSRVDDVDFNFSTIFNQGLSVSGPLSIEKITLAGGIDISRVKAELRMPGADTLILNDIKAEIFEGQLNLASLQYENNRIADTRADFTHVNLDRILAFADVDGLKGTGYLDIALPISEDALGMTIKNGTFNSTGPGRLSYRQKAASAANIGMQALENFHYKQLSGTIHYQADGQYQIGVRLEGNNPELYGGYPVVFNLSINGVMPKLFESMFITGSFEEAILNQVKSR